MVGIIDYGMGNLGSVYKALLVNNINVEIIKEPKECDAIVLPGVGAFKDAINNLKAKGFDEFITHNIKMGKPFLGICLGLQLLFDKSYEFGESEGLKIFRGEIKLLPTSVKIPHVGWNQLWFRKKTFLNDYVKEGDFVYFVHSYRVVTNLEEIILTTTDYGEDFVSSIFYENILAFQFHPEKSQKVGLNIIKAFKEKFKL